MKTYNQTFHIKVSIDLTDDEQFSSLADKIQCISDEVGLNGDASLVQDKHDYSIDFSIICRSEDKLTLINKFADKLNATEEINLL